ncbi:MAG: 5-(carboxyamino)imidazole ribonucleotide synthase [Pseudomonadota bacterium]|nr:5-(carboxyamino)imidazole ribonucleotide synthase [Pseudomonadota bacterium]
MAGLRPGATIGMLGGGQLGRMLAMAAARLGFVTVTYDPATDCPAAQTASRHMAAAWDDAAALEAFAGQCDVVTYEFENVPVEAVACIARTVPVWPDARALETARDRLAEKTFLRGLGIATAPFLPVDDEAGLRRALGDPLVAHGAILKTCRMGYDGKGQVPVAAGVRDADPAAIWQAVGGVACILEGFVDFALEISVVAARGAGGAFRAYDPACNCHREGILRQSVVPAPIASPVAESAISIARTIMDGLDYRGVMGVECFVTRQGDVLVNEIAPRVHNSGHWTEAACLVSQFEQHVRAISGLPLGDPARHSDCVMENLIGGDVDRVPALLRDGRGLVHLYGKAQTRPGRKMGHVTWLSPLGQGSGEGPSPGTARP